MGWLDQDSVNGIAKLNVLLDKYFTKMEKYLVVISNREENMMSALEDLKNIVSVLAEDAAAQADEVNVAVDLLKQLVVAGTPHDDPAVLDAVAKLEVAHANFKDATARLKDEVDSINVSGGVVYP